MIRISTVSSVALALLLPARAPAQAGDTLKLIEVVVSATRAPMTPGALPVAVTVLQGSDLRARGLTTVGDALNDVASAYVAQTGSRGGTTSLFLRGGESKYVKVLIDGVAVNDPGGVYDFASLSTDNIERIEIVRGPASVVHGADAVTGVVQIFTRRPIGRARAEAEARVSVSPRSASGGVSQGSMRATDVSGSYLGAWTGGSYAFGVAGHESNGLYRLNNAFSNRVFSARVAMRPAEGTDLRFVVRYNDYAFHYPTNSAGDVVDSNAFRDEDRTVIGLEVERSLSKTLRSVLALNSSLNDGGTDDGADAAGNSFVSQDKTRRRGADWRLQWTAARVITTLGVATETQDQHSQSQSQSAFGPFYSSFRASRRNQGGYLEAVASASDQLTATAGVRVDDNQRFGTFISGRAGLAWRPNDATKLRVSASNAFREPLFFENYATGFVQGNPGLRPEQARTVDAGVERFLLSGRAWLGVSAFVQRFRDMIDYSSSNPCGFSYCNVAEAKADGLEMEAHGRVVSGLSAAVSGTFLTTEVIAPGYDSTSGGQYRRGEALIRRPATKWSGELAWRDARPLSAAARLVVVGPRGDRDFHFPSTPVTLPSYARVDVNAEYRLRTDGQSGTVLSLRIENLLDEEYQNVFNFLAPRRTVSIGMRTGL